MRGYAKFVVKSSYKSRKLAERRELQRTLAIIIENFRISFP